MYQKHAVHFHATVVFFNTYDKYNHIRPAPTKHPPTNPNNDIPLTQMKPDDCLGKNLTLIPYLGPLKQLFYIRL